MKPTTGIGAPESPEEKARKAELAKIEKEVETLAAARSLYLASERALATLSKDPHDAAAHEAAGRYLCLVQHRWDEGLPHLAQASDIRLRGIASLELASPRSPEQIQMLGDQYWDLAAKFKLPERRGLHLQAVYCYELAAQDIANSLEKVRGQKRTEEAISLYGRERVEQILEPVRATRNVKRGG